MYIYREREEERERTWLGRWGKGVERNEKRRSLYESVTSSILPVYLCHGQRFLVHYYYFWLSILILPEQLVISMHAYRERERERERERGEEFCY